jgi:hypothetical protein
MPRVQRVTHEQWVIERLKLGPLTAALATQIKRLDCTVYRLQKKGWPVISELRPFFDGDGAEHRRVEYRLGNWAGMSFPIHRIATKRNKPVDSSAGTTQRGRDDTGS